MTRDKFIKTLEGYVGVMEGSNTHRAICERYNTISPLPRGYKLSTSDPWCAGFVSALWWSFNREQWFPYECSCSQMVSLAKQKGVFYKEPIDEIGWLVFYDWERDGSPDHVGYIVGKTSMTIDVIEGNYSNAVKKRTIASSSKAIYGVVQLKYDGSEVEDAKSFVTKNGIMLGDGTDTYWQNPPTREQLATILYRFYTKT